MKIAMAWGCLIPTRRSLIGYEAATRKVLDQVGVEIVDIPNETCCAPFWMQSLDLTTSLAMAARNLAKAEEMGLDLLTPCSGCFHSYKRVNHTLKEYPEMRERINQILADADLEYNGGVTSRHLVDYLYTDIGIHEIEKHITTDLEGLELILRYGCHMLKPHELLNIEYSERPTFADELLESLGLKSIQYAGRHRCCGGNLRGIQDEIADWILRERLTDAKNTNADALVTVCALCHIQHDMGQKSIQRKFAVEGLDMPVLHYPQIIALAFGYSPKEIGLDLHTANTAKFVSKFKKLSKGGAK